jgi:hypothetical protein
MSNRNHTLAAAIAAACAMACPAAFAGGSLDTVDITAGNVTVPTTVDGDVIPIKWDSRCIPIGFTLDTTPPNAFNAAPDIAVATARTELQTSFDQWNAIRTSFIEMNITAEENLRGGALTPNGVIGGFDFVNEINFVTQGGFLAAAPSTALIRDTTLTAGQDIDGDGDSDVYAPGGGNTTCMDADSDGDIEFPAGSYEAGTILDNDIGFNAAVQWNTIPDATNQADIQAIAVHEFGHSHGLSHSLINQFSRTDGEGATMFPFIDTNDPASESAQRTLATDDAGWSSFLYQENSAHSGPGALQAGDRGFDSHYGLVRGEVTSGTQGGPVAGANVWVQTHGGKVVASGYSGTTRLLVRPGASGITDADAGLFFGPDAAFSVLNGNYTIPVPAGDYVVGLQSLDGSPAAPGNISNTAVVGGRFSDLNFQEEFWNRELEGANETQPGQAFSVRVNNGGVTHVDFVTNVTESLRYHDNLVNAIGFTNLVAGNLYAVRFNNADVQAMLAGGSVLHTGILRTHIVDASEPAAFASARLCTGVTNPDGSVTVNLAAPLATLAAFTGQDADGAPWFFKNPEHLTANVLSRLSADPNLHLFLVLETGPGPYGVSNIPPLVGLDTNTTGTSFISPTGTPTFTPVGQNIMFDLVARP